MKKTTYFIDGYEFDTYRNAEIYAISNGIHCEEIEEEEHDVEEEYVEYLTEEMATIKADTLQAFKSCRRIYGLDVCQTAPFKRENRYTDVHCFDMSADEFDVYCSNVRDMLEQLQELHNNLEAYASKLHELESYK